MDIKKLIDDAVERNEYFFSLNNLGLTDLPDEIRQLDKIRHLDLGKNQLSYLPSNVLSLKNLKTLVLSGNKFQQLTEDIDQLSNLEQLYLGDNSLYSLPKTISNLNKLEVLELYHNKFSTFPKQIYNIKTLKNIDLSGCIINSLHEDIELLDNLSELDLSDTNLLILTPKIGTLAKLYKLILTENKLQYLPEEIYKLTNLNILKLRGNRISHISPAIGNLTNLKELDLSFNRLTSLPPEVCQLSNLATFNLRDNSLIDLPQDICNLKKLENLNLDGNKLPQDCDDFIEKRPPIHSLLEFFSIYFKEDAKRKEMRKKNKENINDYESNLALKHIIVFSALNEEIEKVKDNRSTNKFPLKLVWTDHNINGLAYSKTQLNDDLDLIAISPNLMGLTETAIVATTAFKIFKPLLTVMIGICAGRHKKDVQLGHIIVPDKAFHYQYGAKTALELEPEILCENVNPNLYTMAEKMKSYKKFDFWMNDDLPKSTHPVARCDCHIGPMASSDLVAKWEELVTQAVKMDRKVIGIDMESYAFLRSAYKCGFLNNSFIIKCVTDYADEEKDDEIREWAQIAPARFFYFMLAYWLDDQIKSDFFEKMITS